MATAAQSTPVETSNFSCFQPGARLFTEADLAAMPTRLPSGDVSFELHHGRLVPMAPPGAVHGSLQSRIATALTVQGEMKGHGKTYTEVGVVLGRKPDHIVGADVAFVASRSLPVRESPEGYLETIPELIVEIRSKNDTTAEIDEKISDYLKAGVKLVWLVDPPTATVIEHRANSSANTFCTTNPLLCKDIIPEFHLALSDLFRA
jgi:Uma2 family endonuclease